MKASILDLRYKMNDVLKALDRNEDVHIHYRGILKGTIKARNETRPLKVTDHPFFNMVNDPQSSVEGLMDQLRGGRNFSKTSVSRFFR